MASCGTKTKCRQLSISLFEFLWKLNKLKEINQRKSFRNLPFDYHVYR